MKRKINVVCGEIARVMTLCGASNADMAEITGMCIATWCKRKSDPNGLTLGQLKAINDFAAKNDVEPINLIYGE